MFDLTGRVVMVTGAGRGIGRGIARALVGQGAAVAVNDFVEESAHETVKQIIDAGGKAHAVPFDVTDFDACAEGIRLAESALGPIDSLVNNAGGTPAGMWPTPFIDTPRDTWPAFLGMNLYGVMNCTRAVIIVLGLIDTVPKECLEQANAANLYPMGRVGTAADVAAGVAYLISDEAGWVTGHSLVINGGGTAR